MIIALHQRTRFARTSVSVAALAVCLGACAPEEFVAGEQTSAVKSKDSKTPDVPAGGMGGGRTDPPGRDEEAGNQNDAGTTMRGGAGGATGAGGKGGMGAGPLCPNPPATRGLIAHWTFDEGSGNQAADDSGNGNTALFFPPSGSPPPKPVWTQGRLGGGIRLDGARSHLRVDASPSLNRIQIQAWPQPANGAFSITGWIKTETMDANAGGTILSRDSSTSTDPMYAFGVFDGKLGASIGPTAGYTSPIMFQAVIPVPSDRWVHVALTYDGITAYLFQDGFILATLDIGAPVSCDSTPVTVGASANGAVLDQFFTGGIDDLRIYDRFLTEDELSALANPSAALP